MKRNHFLFNSAIALSVAGLLSIVETAAAASDTKSTKPDQHQMRDNTTTKSKLEGQTQDGGGDANFKELNKHAPGGPKAAPDVKRHNQSGGAGTGTGSGTGTTGASGGSGSGGSGSGGN